MTRLARMQARWHSWQRLLSRRELGTTLALFRIAVSAVMLFSLLSVLFAGVARALWIDRAYGGMRSVYPGMWPLSLLGPATPQIMWPLLALAVASATAMLLGFGGRVSVLIALWSYRSVSAAGSTSGGYDSMIFDAAWLLALSQCTETLSVDCKRRCGEWISARKVPAWPRYLVIFQLVVIYLATGLQKASASWTFADGYSALYWFLQDPTWLRFDTGWTAQGYRLTQLATALVWHFEVGAPILLLAYYYRYTQSRPGRLRAWFNRHNVKGIFAAIGLSMHLGILILLDMGPFSWISMAYYICLLRPRQAHALLARFSTHTSLILRRDINLFVVLSIDATVRASVNQWLAEILRAKPD